MKNAHATVSIAAAIEINYCSVAINSIRATPYLLPPLTQQAWLTQSTTATATLRTL